MSRQILHCSHSGSAPSGAAAKTYDEEDVSSIFPSDTASENAQPSTKSSKIKSQSEAQQPRCHNCTRKLKVHNHNFCLFEN